MTEPHGPAQSAGVHCIHCQYDLTSIRIGDNCPECGMPVAAAYHRATTPQTSGKAIASLLLGILSIGGCFAFVLPALVMGPLAIFFGYSAQKDVHHGQASPGSDSIAVAGMITGIIGTLLGAIMGLMILITELVG